ncbi:MAG TPA: SDR family oxidoreductase [Stellaceae bacterium]|jgi:NAD(P)-dependent dehydrogenase (short-subunit alcohol dehydrogenase family)
MPLSLAHRVVVVTGASSGIGRATAHEFARHGCRLVLAARREHALADAAAECRARGAQAIYVPTDMTDAAAVEDLARIAIETFGGIDVWVNNAGVLMLGRFDQEPQEDFRQVIETNLFGYVNGARAAMPHFLKRGGGVLINNASIAGHLGQPYSAAYVASKFAVRGFTIALRQDYQDVPGIQICAVSPSSIDTPIWQHAANYSGRAYRAVHPTYDPYAVARTIVSLARRPRREAVVGTMGQVMVRQHALMPDMTERMMGWMARATTMRDEPEGPRPGTLHGSGEDGLAVRGGWQVMPEVASRAIALAALAAVPLGIMLMNRRRRDGAGRAGTGGPRRRRYWEEPLRLPAPERGRLPPGQAAPI